jgi:hypothetical protein
LKNNLCKRFRVLGKYDYNNLGEKKISKVSNIVFIVVRSHYYYYYYYYYYFEGRKHGKIYPILLVGVLLV